MPALPAGVRPLTTVESAVVQTIVPTVKVCRTVQQQKTTADRATQTPRTTARLTAQVFGVVLLLQTHVACAKATHPAALTVMAFQTAGARPMSVEHAMITTTMIAQLTAPESGVEQAR
eukprot:COSAG02_NODE_2426_length_8891_cov_4.565059_1_plen_118_part_00